LIALDFEGSHVVEVDPLDLPQLAEIDEALAGDADDDEVLALERPRM
jgi:hypothetical protein